MKFLNQIQVRQVGHKDEPWGKPEGRTCERKWGEMAWRNFGAQLPGATVGRICGTKLSGEIATVGALREYPAGGEL